MRAAESCIFKMATWQLTLLIISNKVMPHGRPQLRKVSSFEALCRQNGLDREPRPKKHGALYRQTVRGLPGIVSSDSSVDRTRFQLYQANLLQFVDKSHSVCSSVVLCLSHVGGRGLQSSTLCAAVGGHQALPDSNFCFEHQSVSRFLLPLFRSPPAPPLRPVTRPASLDCDAWGLTA